MLTGTIVPSDPDRGASRFVRVNISLPPSLDWRDFGLVSEVKMQVWSQYILPDALITLTSSLNVVHSYLTGFLWLLLGLQCSWRSGGAIQEDYRRPYVPQSSEPGGLFNNIWKSRVQRWLHVKCFPLRH